MKIRDHLRVMVAQTNTTNEHASNIEALEKLVIAASEQACDMLCLPEASGLMNQDAASAVKQIVDESEDPYVAACQALSKEHKIWIHNGSTPVLGDEEKAVNRTLLFNNEGVVVGRYDKIHLFDIYLPDGKERLESKRYSAGRKAVLVDTPWGLMGLTICYDLRFPNLYREYAQAGARVIFVPSAFMRKTGDAHWEVLLRARAIENGCFIVAAAQTGEHADGRKTFGHSLVVHPWGNVLLDLGTGVSAAVVELELGETAQFRERIPSLEHDRPYDSAT